MALELVTFDDLASLLKLTDAAITDYPALEVINDTMISAFERYLGRDLNKEDRTVIVWANDFKKKMIMLKAIPISSITSVTLKYGGDTDTESLEEDDDYFITEYGIKLFSSIRNAKLTIVYNGGIAAVSEEPNLNRAALYQIGYEFQTKDWIGSESVSTEGGNVTRPELSLLKEVKRMIKSSTHPLYTGKP